MDSNWWKRLIKWTATRVLLFTSYSKIGQTIKRVLGKDLVTLIKPSGWDNYRVALLRGTIRPPYASTNSHLINSINGLNVIGYIFSETGVGEVARNSLHALHAQQYPVAYTNLVEGDPARQNDTSCADFPTGHPYSVNLFHTNAEQTFGVLQTLGPEFFSGQRNIAYWFWELNRFPVTWQDRFEVFNEIWVASDFVKEAVGGAASIPVIKLPPAVAPVIMPGLTRSSLGLPEDKFIFIFSFDALGIYERKNPAGVIEAYRRAFGSRSKNTTLVIKANNLAHKAAGQAEYKKLLDDIKNTGTILMDSYLDRKTTNSLYKLSDCFVSLHRSEGFGLPLAEAMYLGKPCIATGYSGNLEFMNSSNSYLVDYDLTTLQKNYGPYEEGAQWADPSIEHAAALMHEVVYKQDEATSRGLLASAHIKNNYSFAVTGQKMIRQLQSRATI